MNHLFTEEQIKERANHILSLDEKYDCEEVGEVLREVKEHTEHGRFQEFLVEDIKMSWVDYNWLANGVRPAEKSEYKPQVKTTGKAPKPEVTVDLIPKPNKRHTVPMPQQKHEPLPEVKPSVDTLCYGLRVQLMAATDRLWDMNGADYGRVLDIVKPKTAKDREKLKQLYELLGNVLRIDPEYDTTN